MEIHITEMDVRLQYAEEDDDKELAAQAETYRRVIDACVEVENCKGFSTWGLIDRFLAVGLATKSRQSWPFIIWRTTSIG